MKKIIKLFVLLLINLYVLNVSAQSMQDFKKTVAAMKSSSLIVEQDKAARIQNLANNLNPTIFINNGLIKKFQNDPAVCVDIDAQSIISLNSIDTLVGNVEFLRIRINSSDDLNYVLNVASLTAYTNLKYILFVSSFDCDPALIKKICVPDSGRAITVFYEISIPN